MMALAGEIKGWVAPRCVLSGQGPIVISADVNGAPPLG
jgi:hypothetical protein